MNPMNDAFKKMRKGGSKSPAPEGSPKEEASETSMQEKQEQDKGLGDRAPSIHAANVSQPIHGDQMHGESHGLHPDLLAIISKLIEAHKPGGGSAGFDQMTHSSMKNLVKPKI